MSNRNRPGRNEACPCGSGEKFKRCHGRNGVSQIVPEIKHMLDMGTVPIRWVITNKDVNAFFSDKQGRILVFDSRDVAKKIANLELFQHDDTHGIYVAGVGPEKWKHLQETLPFLEVHNLETAAALIEERILDQRAKLGYEEFEPAAGEDQ